MRGSGRGDKRGHREGGTKRQGHHDGRRFSKRQWSEAPREAQKFVAREGRRNREQALRARAGEAKLAVKEEVLSDGKTHHYAKLIPLLYHFGAFFNQLGTTLVPG